MYDRIRALLADLGEALLKAALSSGALSCRLPKKPPVSLLRHQSELCWHAGRWASEMRLPPVFRTASLSQQLEALLLIASQPSELGKVDALALQKLIAYQREFHALKERLRIAEHRTLQRSSELNTILEQFRRAVAETNGSKMFQSPDITLIVEFIFMFYKEKPIDWLLDHILWVKVCNPEKDATEELVLSKETKDKRLEDGYFRIGKFENGIAEGTVDPSLNPVSSFRLSVIQNSAVWAILNENGLGEKQQEKMVPTPLPYFLEEQAGHLYPLSPIIITNLKVLDLSRTGLDFRKLIPFYKQNKKSIRAQKSEVETADFVIAFSEILFVPKEGSERGRPWMQSKARQKEVLNHWERGKLLQEREAAGLEYRKKRVEIDSSKRTTAMLPVF
ncbi:Alpha-1,3-mannosyl-glycoprotein 4-beta-N-acetylglucosaminyltransferase A [Aix galericulata]|nr:Alpha-1,3-mannosyl-glycoprotein 4-beta-N-acetylglucosaminyltransferase A [Aix galericulata]